MKYDSNHPNFIQLIEYHSTLSPHQWHPISCEVHWEMYWIHFNVYLSGFAWVQYTTTHKHLCICSFVMNISDLHNEAPFLWLIKNVWLLYIPDVMIWVLPKVITSDIVLSIWCGPPGGWGGCSLAIFMRRFGHGNTGDITALIARFTGQHGAHLGPTGPRWAPCWPHEPCYLGGLSRGIHQPAVIPLTKAHWWFIFSLLLVWTSCWTNSWAIGVLRCHDAHVTSLLCFATLVFFQMLSINNLPLRASYEESGVIR